MDEVTKSLPDIAKDIAHTPIEFVREIILEVERQMRARPDAVGPEAFVTRHHFAPGTYAREIELPAGSRVVGKIHRESHVNVISKGHCLVATPDGGVEELCAPFTFISAPGTKRVVWALADTVWTTIHANPANVTDLDKLEAQLISPTFEALAADPPPLLE